MEMEMLHDEGTQKNETGNSPCALTPSWIRHQDVLNMITYPDEEKRSHERKRLLLFHVVRLLTAIAAILGLSLLMDKGLLFHSQHILDDHWKDCLVTAVICVAAFHVAICRPFMETFIYPKYFPLKTWSWIGRCFEASDLIQILEIEDILLQNSDGFSCRPTEDGLEVRVYSAGTGSVYQLKRHRSIPRRYFFNHLANFDFSWLDGYLFKYGESIASQDFVQRRMDLIRKDMMLQPRNRVTKSGNQVKRK